MHSHNWSVFALSPFHLRRGLRNQCRLPHKFMNAQHFAEKRKPQNRWPVNVYVIFGGAHWIMNPSVFFLLSPQFQYCFMHEFIPFACGCSIDELISCARFQCLRLWPTDWIMFGNSKELKTILQLINVIHRLSRMMQPHMNYFTFSPAFLHRTEMSLLCETQSLNQTIYKENTNYIGFYNERSLTQWMTRPVIKQSQILIRRQILFN